MRRTMFLTGILAVTLVSLAFANTPVKMRPVLEDRAPEIINSNPEAFCDVLWACDTETPANDNRQVGVGILGDYFYVTGASHTDLPNYIYKFDMNCNLIATYNQWTSSAWGLRDLAEWDGLLWGSDAASNIDGFDGDGNYITSVPGCPENPNRALAYDQVNNEWWCGNFGSNIWHFSSPPYVLINSAADALTAKYGMAYDNQSPDGPWLWVFNQDPYTLHQYDPATYTYTGVTCLVNTGLGSTYAGGCDWYDLDGDILVLIQGTPDHVGMVDITEGGAPPDTAYCAVTGVSTDASRYLPGDEICLSVNWKFSWSGNGSPGWSNPEDFKVGGGVGKEPNGQPRYIQNVVLYDVAPGSYTEMFYFNVPLATPLGVEGGGGGHCWPTWSGPGQPEQSILIEHNLFVIDESPDYLIWDIDPTPITGAAVGVALDGLGRSWENVVGSLMDYNLPDYHGLYVCLGIYSNNVQIAAGSPEAMAIEAYVNGGGFVYMEGGDTWYYDPQYMGAHDFGPLFGIMALADGSSDLYNVDGMANTLMPGLDPLTSAYFGENNWIDQITAMAPAENVFENVAGMYVCGVANAGAGKTVGTSFELGGTGFVNEAVGCFDAWAY